jgi:hypothetical protein
MLTQHQAPVAQPVILSSWEAEISRIKFQGQPKQVAPKWGAKWTGGVAQAVEHLLCKHKALNSNSMTAKNKDLIQQVPSCFVCEQLHLGNKHSLLSHQIAEQTSQGLLYS